jgi:hypothetical protein
MSSFYQLVLNWSVLSESDEDKNQEIKIDQDLTLCALEM